MRSLLGLIAFPLVAVTAAVAGCVASGVGPVATGDGGGNAGSIMMTGVAGSGVGGTGSTGASGGGGGTACAMPPTASLLWSIFLPNAQGGPGAPASCAQVGATTLQLFMNAKSSQFTCSAQSGTTVGLTPGMYTPRVVLTNAQGVALALGDLPAVTIPSCGVTEAGNVSFVVSSSGAGGTGGSAGSTGTGGSGGSPGTAGTGGGTGPCNALPIFAMHQCAYAGACHDNKGTSANFDMQTSGWEKTLVGRLSKAGGGAGFNSQCLTSGTPYLVANSSPARGLFLDKLNDVRPPCGEQMPLLPPVLTPSELDCVQRWANGLTK